VDEGKLGVNLFENPARGATRNCTVQAEFGRLKKAMGEIVDEPKGTCKFKR
jgi:hypothetical protein